LRLPKPPKPHLVVGERFDLCFQIYDATDNMASGDNTTIVEIELVSSSSAQLLGVTRRRAVQGQVCFTDLYVEKVFGTAQIYARAAIGEAQSSLLTANFTATSQLQPAALVITSSPVAVLNAGDAISVGFEVYDSFGNYLNASVPVDVALVQRAPANAAQAEEDAPYVEMSHLLSGIQRVLAVGGRGKFASLRVQQAGSAYLLAISSPLLQAVSPRTSPFMVEAAAAVATQLSTPPPSEAEAGVSFIPSLVVQVNRAALARHAALSMQRTTYNCHASAMLNYDMQGTPCNV
jgi:hypothetical protein